MNRKKRTSPGLLVFWFVILGVPCVVLWREDQQQRLNQQLIAAINQDDTPSALLALAHGAEVNSCNDLQSTPAWRRILDLVQGRGQISSRGLTPLLLSITHNPKNNPELVGALLAHGAHTNTPEFGGWARTYTLLRSLAGIFPEKL